METKDIIIIGGGAAGLMASCAAAHVLKKHGSVLVLEGNAKLGRKLLATGNGRCNLTNLNVSPAHYHGDVTAIQDLLHEYTPEAICAVFREMGLVTKSDSEGRVYPQNQQAAAVLSALRWDAEKYGVSFSEERTVSKIEKVKNGFTLICTDGTQLFTKQCILTCGGAASPRHSCGEGYTLAKQLGHTVTKLYPSLTQLTVRAKQWKTLSGTRAPANAVLLADGKSVYEAARCSVRIPASPVFACSAFPYMPASSMRSARSAIRSTLHSPYSSIFCRTWPIRTYSIISLR